jgi:hypothetical protein
MKNIVIATTLALNGVLSFAQTQDETKRNNLEIQQYQATVAKNINTIVWYVPLPEGIKVRRFSQWISEITGLSTRWIYISRTLSDKNETESYLYVGVWETKTQFHSKLLGSLDSTSPLQVQVLLQMKF